MSIDRALEKRSNDQCEFCGSTEQLSVYKVPETPASVSGEAAAVYACATCVSQFDDENRDVHHWRCLNDSMWSAVSAVQVMSWRMLHRLKGEGWPQDLLDMLYLDEATLEWAAAAGDNRISEKTMIHRDVNGNELQAGDSVVLIKDLKVKGSSMVAKQGTAVRRIYLDPENHEYIEGKVDGQTIVIITQYVKKL